MYLEFYFVDGYKELPENITDSTVSMGGWKDINVPVTGNARFRNGHLRESSLRVCGKRPRTVIQNGAALVTRGEPVGFIEER